MVLAVVLTLSPSLGDSDTSYTGSSPRPQTTYASYQTVKYQ